MREAAIWSLLWIAVSIAFVVLLWWYLGGTSGDAARADLEDYLTGDRWYQSLGEQAPRAVAYRCPANVPVAL